MKKLVLSAAVLLAAVCACQKEAPQQDNTPVEKSICTMTVDASKAPVTKALANGTILWKYRYEVGREDSMRHFNHDLYAWDQRTPSQRALYSVEK